MPGKRLPCRAGVVRGVSARASQRRGPANAGLGEKGCEAALVFSQAGRRFAFPRHHRASGKRQAPVGQNQFRIERQTRPKPFARRARAVRTVEAERAGLQFLVADLAVGAGVLGAEESVVPDTAVGRLLLMRDQHQAIAVADRQIDRLADPIAHPFANHHAVDHRFDVVLFLRATSAGGSSTSITWPSMRARRKPGLADRFDPSLCSPSAAAHQRARGSSPACLGAEFHHGVEDLLGRLLADRFAALVAPRLAQPGEQQPQVVVDFRDRGHGAARIVAPARWSIEIVG